MRNRLTIAIGLVIICSLIGVALDRMGVDDPEFALLPAIVGAWLLGDVTTGLLTISFSVVDAYFLFIPPEWSVRLPKLADAVSFLLYILVTAFVCYVIQGQKNRISELLDDNLQLQRRLLDRQRIDRASRLT